MICRDFLRIKLATTKEETEKEVHQSTRKLPSTCSKVVSVPYKNLVFRPYYLITVTSFMLIFYLSLKYNPKRIKSIFFTKRT